MNNQVLLLALILSVFYIISLRIIYLIGYRKGFKKKIESMYKLRFKFRTELENLKRSLSNKNINRLSDQFGKMDTDIIRIIHLKKQIDKMDLPDK